MPKTLRARAAHDEQEERWVHKLATSRHGPADWVLHARMVVSSWDGQRVEAIARQLHCSAQTVRRRLHRFDAEGIEGLGDRSRSGRPRRLRAEDDSRILDEVTGINVRIGEMVVAELGLQLERFPDEAHLCSWLGLCPAAK